MERIILKISSGLIVDRNGVKEPWLKQLAKLVTKLQENQVQVWLVTSGALAIYKHKNGETYSLDDKSYHQGQHDMFNIYRKIFSSSNLDVVEVLLSKEDFKHRKKYLRHRTYLQKVASGRQIALINEKENINSEHKFSDNDEIAGLIASILNADLVIFASTVPGIIDNMGDCVSEVKFGQKFWTAFVDDRTSKTGKGGMLLKCRAAEHSARRGIDAVICDGRDMQNIQNIIDGKKTGTRFIADKRMVAKKRWIFDKKDFSNSWIMVDEGLGSVIREGQPASLLTVGVQGVGGDFKENEVIAIKDSQGIIGYGEVRYDARNVKKLINNKESKILIHYDQYVRIT